MSDFAAAVLIALALSVALGVVSGLSWPYDGDHFRDIAQAQTVLNGHPLSDPYYAGEWVWYNPLVSWLVAFMALAAGVPAWVAHVQYGPWLNLLGPVAFYVLGVRVAGRQAALIALGLLLFVNCGTDPSLTCATYSPWLFVATFAQGLGFLGLLAIDEARRRGTDLAALGAGALAGLAFLAHTAPALILGGVALVMLRPRHLLLAGAAAALVASPFLMSIAGHYHLHVVNDAGVAWAWAPTTRGGIVSGLGSHALLLLGGVAGAFLVRSRVAYAWTGAALLFMAYGLLREGTSLPAFVPTFHFWRYAMAAATLFAGAALAWPLQRLPARVAAVALPVVLLAGAVWWLPTYRNRFDFVYGRGVAADRRTDLNDTAAFLRKSVPYDSVVLGSRGLTLEVIAPSGHRVVGVNANWSNPYLPAAPRIAARDAMLADIAAGRTDAFDAAADEYGVTHTVGMGAGECDAMARIGLRPLYRFGEVCVFERRPVPMR